MSRKLIGQCMVDANLLTQVQLDELLEYQKTASERVLIGRLTVELGFLKEEQFVPFLAGYFEVPYVDLKEYAFIQRQAIDSIPESIAEQFNVFPLRKDEDTLTVAMSDPCDVVTMDALETITRCHIKPVLSVPNQIRYNIFLYYFLF
jgi:type IV pilus assembly protein PilB